MEINNTNVYLNSTNNEKKIEQVEVIKTVLIIIVIFILFAIIHSAFKTWCYCRRNENSTFNSRTIFLFIIYSIETIGNYLMLLSSITCIYMFVVYKGQTVLHISLPDERSERIIKIFTIVSFAAKIVEMISLMRHHRSVNIFFIDWEQPRKIIDNNINRESPHTSLKKSYLQNKYSHGRCKSSERPGERIKNRQNNKRRSKTNCRSDDYDDDDHDDDNNRECYSPSKEFCPAYIDINTSSRDCDDLKLDYCSVSAWRTCFVANQWLGIKTKRKTNVIFQIAATLFILEIVGVKFWALANPKWSLVYDRNSQISDNFIFQYAIATGTFIFVYSVQWFLYTLYETHIKNCLQEFVDLCSVANISIFILSHNYLGYYIHGRSVHGYADKDLVSLINDLESEKNNQCAHRGLVPGTREQMFVVTVSKTFRTFYDTILINAINNENVSKFSQRFLLDKNSWNERWKTRSKLHEFFCSHLDHCLKHVDYTVQEKRFVEKLCDIEFTNTPDKSIFYIDKNYSFNQTIFYGNEWALATFELITFLFVLALGGNWIICAGVTLLMSKLIACIAQIDQKKQLAAKTLIDRRFLI